MEINGVLTGRIIHGFYNVYNTLGCGFLEKVYENALKVELESDGLRVETQRPIQVMYKGVVIGQYYADMFVEDCILVEIKSVNKLVKEHESQLINYLVATKTELGLILNFGPVPGIMRKVNTFNRNT